jgi:hypothetical protein
MTPDTEIAKALANFRRLTNGNGRVCWCIAREPFVNVRSAYGSPGNAIVFAANVMRHRGNTVTEDQICSRIWAVSNALWRPNVTTGASEVANACEPGLSKSTAAPAPDPLKLSLGRAGARFAAHPTGFPVRDDSGGAEGIRTPGLLIANETRYQLRHSPLRAP